MNSWRPVLEQDGRLVINGENIVLQNIETSEIGYVENTPENRQLLTTNDGNTNGGCEEKSEEENVETNNDSYKFKWTHALTKSVIYYRLSKEKEFSKPKCKKIKMWHDIAKTINTEYKFVKPVSAEECDNKFCNLLKTYKINKKKQNTSGEEAISWEYFSDFDEVLGCKASIKPPEATLFDTLHIDQEEVDPTIERNDSVINDTTDECIPPANKKKKFSEGGPRLRDENVLPPASAKNKRTLEVKEYLFLKNKREEEKEKRQESFQRQKWEEEKQLRKEETNAILKLAEAIAGKTSKD